MDYRTPYTIHRAKMYEGRTPTGEGLMALLALTKEESSFVDNIARDFLQTFFSVVAKEIVRSQCRSCLFSWAFCIPSNKILCIFVMFGVQTPKCEHSLQNHL